MYINVFFNKILGIVMVNSSNPFVQWFLRILALSQAISPVGWPVNYELKDGEKFDFIVVGAGSAGAIVAARLSELSLRVLLLEAGGDPPPASVIPSLFPLLMHTEYDWNYEAYFDQGTGQAHSGGILPVSRGKMLGGCSSNNYEVYSRGVPEDYEEWNTIAPGWGWETVLNYFKKSECMTDPLVLESKSGPLHSTSGPVKISRPIPNKYFQKLNDVFLESLEELGIKRILEINGYETLGASTPHFTFANGRRSSTAEAYLRENTHNIHISKFARVIKILINPKTSEAYGVQVVLTTGEIINVYTDKEVILSAGTIDTPKLLMLSGIGPKSDLEKLNIDIIADLPVGKNLHDHQAIPLFITGEKSLSSAFQNFLIPTELDTYPVPLQVALFKLNNSNDSEYLQSRRPVYQIFNNYIGTEASPIVYFGCRSIVNLDPSFCLSISKANLGRELDALLLILLHPQSRGRVTLKSANYGDDPVIELGYFRSKRDVNVAADGLHFISKVVDTSYYRQVNGDIIKVNVKGCEDIAWGSYEYWRCYAVNTAISMSHPVGTCAMGHQGVVDERLRVHGVGGLRIADASIIPTIPSGNTNAPTMMIGEKAADMIKEDYGYIHHQQNFKFYF